MDRPDLVLVMTDQQRFDQVGYVGGGHYDTPTLDGLASNGVVFEQAYSASTTCIPARVGLLTGLQAHRVPVLEADGLSPAEGIWTVARALRRAGYQTALVGKMHLRPIHARHGFEIMQMCEHLEALSPGRPADDRDDYGQFLGHHGLADWRTLPPPLALGDDLAVWGGELPLFPYDPYFHPTEWVAREARRVVAERDPTRPLLLVVSFLHPHSPYNPPDAYVRRYDPEDAVLPPDDFAVNNDLPPFILDALGAGDGLYRPNRAPARRHFLARLVTLVRAMVRHVDDAMGRVLSSIDTDRSVVAFTSDHGDYAGHRGLVRKVPWIPFDDLARVPLVVRSPSGVAGSRVTTPVQSSDLALTFLDFAGVDAPDFDFTSRSLRPVLETGIGQADTDRSVFSATNVGWPMVRRGDLKLIRRGDDRVLFDLATDPGERENRSGQRRWASDLRHLEAELDEELARPVVSIGPPVGPAHARVPADAVPPTAAG